jgi:hypothetical protein
MKVVGITLLAQTQHTSFDEGGWVTPRSMPFRARLGRREKAGTQVAWGLAPWRGCRWRA